MRSRRLGECAGGAVLRPRYVLTDGTLRVTCACGCLCPWAAVVTDPSFDGTREVAMICREHHGETYRREASWPPMPRSVHKDFQHSRSSLWWNAILTARLRPPVTASSSAAPQCTPWPLARQQGTSHQGDRSFLVLPSPRQISCGSLRALQSGASRSPPSNGNE